MSWLWIALLLGGDYSSDRGAHPAVTFAVDVKAGAGPVYGGFRHVPVSRLERGELESVSDLFYWYAGGELPIASSSSVEISIALEGGYSIWRTWVCRGTSCEPTPGPGQKFQYANGLGLGGGFVLEAGVLRTELKYLHHFASRVPTTGGFQLLVGAVFEP